MGGSRRKLKKNLPKQRVGVVKRKKNQKAPVPLEILDLQPHRNAPLQDKLHISPDWKQEKTLVKNYAQNNLVLDPNHGFGRNKTKAPLKSKEEREANQEPTFDDDDELRAACNLQRHTGGAPPPRLTAHQRQVITALLATHGDDVDAMVLDRKLNKMQHSAGKLRQLIEGLQYWGASRRHDFRGPMKPFKKL